MFGRLGLFFWGWNFLQELRFLKAIEMLVRVDFLYTQERLQLSSLVVFNNWLCGKLCQAKQEAESQAMNFSSHEVNGFCNPQVAQLSGTASSRSHGIFGGDPRPSILRSRIAPGAPSRPFLPRSKGILFCDPKTRSWYESLLPIGLFSAEARLSGQAENAGTLCSEGEGERWLAQDLTYWIAPLPGNQKKIIKHDISHDLFPDHIRSFFFFAR